MYWNSLLAKRVEAKYAEAVRTSNLESIAEFSAVFVATVEEQSLGLAVIVTLHELNKHLVPTTASMNDLSCGRAQSCAPVKSAEHRPRISPSAPRNKLALPPPIPRRPWGG